MSWRHRALNIEDLKNITLWYERLFANEIREQTDTTTIIKIRAMLIYLEEDKQEDERHRRWR